jgi:hypothetical protein
MDVEINSKVASVNDTFVALMARDLTVQETMVLPAGTVIEGRVVTVEPSGLGRRPGRLQVVFENLKSPGGERRIDGVLTTDLIAPKHTDFDWLTIIGGSAAGTAVGASVSSAGAEVGAAIGAAVGTGIALLHRGKDVRIKKGQEFEIVIRKEVVLPVLDY